MRAKGDHISTRAGEMQSAATQAMRDIVEERQRSRRLSAAIQYFYEVASLKDGDKM
jgi:hypothetical protein